MTSDEEVRGSGSPHAGAEEQPARSAPRRRRKRSQAPRVAEPKPLADESPETAAEATPKPASRPEPKRVKPALKDPAAAPSGFAALGLSEVMLDALVEAEYMDPTPVQAGFIPRALAGVDVMGQAQTGTGKTAAFAIPILEKLKPHRKGAPPQALMLVPTRELAVQVRDECFKLAGGRVTSIVALYGGKPIRQQIDHLNRGADMIVGTPGRVLDLMSRGVLSLGELQIVVLDEADRMLDIGFPTRYREDPAALPCFATDLAAERYDRAAGQAAGRALHADAPRRWTSRRRTWRSKPSSNSISPSIR